MDRSYDLQSWKVFAAVARTGSISAVCRAFDTDAANISRILQSLEKSLGAGVLLDRSVRPLALTENGRVAFRYAEQMLKLREEMSQTLNHEPDALKGILRVGLPPMVLRDLLTPGLMAYSAENPDIDLRADEYVSGLPINFSDGRGSLFDVIISYGPSPTNHNLVQMTYGRGFVIPCASPTYLKRYGRPETPADLAEHTGIVVNTHLRGSVTRLRRGSENVPVYWKKQLVFNSASSAKTAALIGTGIHLSMPMLHCFREIERGELVPLLTDWKQPLLDLYIYTRPECLKLARVRHFIRWYRKTAARFHRECYDVFKPFCQPI